MKKILKFFTPLEYILIIISVATPIIFYVVFKGDSYLNLACSLLGVISLFFISKANLIGTFISLAFGIFYGIVSLGFKYYGEAIITLALYIPFSIFSIVTWFKNRKEKSTEVKISHATKIDFIKAPIIAIAISTGFYFILKALDTTNLIVSTLSILTSCVAGYFQIKRTKYYALFYTFNDIILIILWTYATIENISYICVLSCFVCFLINDIYGFINWTRLEKKTE